MLMKSLEGGGLGRVGREEGKNIDKKVGRKQDG